MDFLQRSVEFALGAVVIAYACLQYMVAMRGVTQRAVMSRTDWIVGIALMTSSLIIVRWVFTSLW